MKNVSLKNGYYFLMLFLIALTVSCKDFLPIDREEVGDDSYFGKTIYEPVLGRTTVISGEFSKGSTSFPVDFKIINPRRFNGLPAPELTDTFPVLVWNEAYTGEETSLAEIEAKRDTEYHRLWEIRPHSGQFVMWATANANFIKAQPDSGYIFDVEMSSSGGRRYFRDFTLTPLRERAYEPNLVDKILGQGTGYALHPSVVRGIQGVRSDRNLGGGDVDVYIHKVGNGHSLTFMFLDTAFHPFDPKKFELTDWEHLVHGFNPTFTDTTVTYQVAYPIPLTERETRYTSSGGSRAHVKFSFDRIGFAHKRIVGDLEFNFAIYEKGDWQIIFAFKNENPKFEDG